MSNLNFTKTALKNLFSKPATSKYPLEPRDYPQRTRGQIAIDIDTCVYCGLCAKKCPTGAIAVNRADKTWSIERFGCIQCGYCIDNCNKNSLSMLQSYTTPGAVKKVDVFTGNKLEETAKPKE